jgi:predicted nucleic acid-binding Zn ribbon protein
MARKKTGRRNRDWRLTVFIIISLIIVLTMILAYLPGFIGGPS